jgi:hypothetical protein
MPNEDEKVTQQLMVKTTHTPPNLAPKDNKPYELRRTVTKTPESPQYELKMKMTRNDSIPMKNKTIDKVKNLEPGSTINNK